LTTPPRHRFQPGTVIDGYRLDERIHHGSMASIWRVTAPGGGPTPLVMKIPRLGEAEDPAAIVAFEVEVMILPTLSGNHTPRYVAAGGLAAQPYIVMEWIDGRSLRAQLDRMPLPDEEVASVGARVAGALHDIHSQHVIHLDVKPSNVMFRESGEAVVIDFGVSRHDRLPDLLAEEFRIPIGTGPYISPEQVRRIRNDPRSDIFALGVVLYHLSTGERPFGNPTSVAGLRRRLYRSPSPPRALREDYPEWLQEIVLKCLEVDPNRRYQTAAQLAFELQHPDRVVLTEAAARRRREGIWASTKRYFRMLGEEPDPRQSVAGHLARAPIVVAAIDLAQRSEALNEAMRSNLRDILRAAPAARLACVMVLKTSRIGMDVTEDEEGRNLHVKGLVDLNHWARPLGLPPNRITYHVLEAPDAGAAIVEFAESNHVAQVVVGSRGSSTLRRYLGSVSSQVVALANCTVTVVKTDDRSELAES